MDCSNEPPNEPLIERLIDRVKREMREVENLCRNHRWLTEDAARRIIERRRQSAERQEATR